MPPKVGFQESASSHAECTWLPSFLSRSDDNGTELEYTCSIRFRHFAWALVVGFIITFVLSAIVTFTGTAYSKDMDKIWLFYGTFNPCIFFDHYPAKVVGGVGMGILVLISIGFDVLLWFYIYAVPDRMCLDGYMSSFLTICAVTDAAFLNVFTTNLYPEEHPDRRLHGVLLSNGTVAFDFEARSDGAPGGDAMLTGEALHTMIVHTTFYIAWIIANLLLSFHVARCFLTKRKGAALLAWAMVLFVGWLACFAHATTNVVSLLRGSGRWNWSELENATQRLVFSVQSATKGNSWAWLLVLIYRLLIPPECGVVFTIRTNSWKSKCLASISPQVIIGNTYRLFTFLLTFGAFFHPSWENDKTTSIPLAAALRSKPFAYIMVPAWTFLSVALLFGLTMALLERRFQQMGLMPLATFVGGLLFVSMHLCWLIVIEQQRFTWVFVLVSTLAFPAWALIQNLPFSRTGWSRPHFIAVTWVIAAVALAVASCYHYVFCFFLGFLYCFYIQAVPHDKKSMIFFSAGILPQGEPRPFGGRLGERCGCRPKTNPEEEEPETATEGQCAEDQNAQADPL